MNSSETKTQQKKRPWKAIAATTVITIIVTIVAAWYTISRTERQFVLAEAERVRNVKNNLVSIIEEHIINQKPIDCMRLTRLIETKSRDEKLLIRITARDLIEQAEYNIIYTRYLDFKQKEEYKAIFDQLYKDMIPVEYSAFKDILYAELLNRLAQNIQEGNIEESMKLLNEYVERLSTELAELEKKKALPDSFIITLFRTPYFAIFMVLYIIFIVLFRIYMRNLRRRRVQSRKLPTTPNKGE